MRRTEIEQSEKSLPCVRVEIVVAETQKKTLIKTFKVTTHLLSKMYQYFFNILIHAETE